MMYEFNDSTKKIIELLVKRGFVGDPVLLWGDNTFNVLLSPEQSKNGSAYVPIWEHDRRTDGVVLPDTVVNKRAALDIAEPGSLVPGLGARILVQVHRKSDVAGGVVDAGRTTVDVVLLTHEEVIGVLEADVAGIYAREVQAREQAVEIQAARDRRKRREARREEAKARLGRRRRSRWRWLSGKGKGQ